MDQTPAHPKLAQAEQLPASPPSRKRQIDSDSGDEPQTKRVRLTRKNLARFDEMGKKKASDPTDESKSTRTTSTTTSSFAHKARDNGILRPVHSQPPKNIKDIRERYARSRSTASPSESDYRHYSKKVSKAGNEATMIYEVGVRMLKEHSDNGYDRAFSRSFTNIPQNAGYNNGLSAPQPDFIEGLEEEEFRPFPIADRIPGATLYDDDPSSLTLPHIAGEWKGRGKDMEEARLQAAYDGAAMVYARSQALAYMEKSEPPGYAAITTFTTDGTNLNLFVHYAAGAEDGTLEYHQYPIKSLNLVDSHEGYKEGRKQLRNAQDLAREESYALKDELKDYWKQSRDSLHPIAEGVPPLPVPELEPLNTTHAYENEDGYEVVELQPIYQPTPPTSSRSKHSHKRKASISQESSSVSSKHSSKHRSYWKKDTKTGCYYHIHSDGTISWLDDDNDEGH